MIDPVIDVAELREPEGRAGTLRLIDIRWALDGSKGETTYRTGHLPGAVYMDLETALAAPATASTGRHPLPDPERFAWALGEAGIDPETTVVAYDDTDGSQASRLVWMLRALGQDAALLDGGLRAWTGPLHTGSVHVDTVSCPVRIWGSDVIADLDEVAAGVPVLLDARAPERYRGEVEPIDARPGHIPGARSAPTSVNTDETGRFRSPEALHAQFTALGADPDGDVVVYCGSGVTATHDLLALERAGFRRARLFPGSYSQWSARDELPVTRGDQP
ncbi:sulfurtransferase [Brachybacterium timonense]|uniref:sulfurtransferase n=1 Tax=Brachybacterium timonense TaxID=2050896 RepID=UPI000D0B52A3|nr:sulfurtransferase [Brachybacterium timonense]